MKIKLYSFFYIIIVLVVITSCNKRNDYNGNVEVINEWNFNMSSTNQNYVITGPQTNANFHMVLLADNSIRYDVKLDSTSGERISSLQIRLGDPVTEGAVLLNLPVRVYGTYGSGTVPGLRGSLLDTLRNSSIDKYINVGTDRVQSGLVRGQLNSTLLLSASVPLTGSAVVPSITTTTSGTAFLRLTNNGSLYSKVMINNNDPADPVTAASINQGISSANGPVIVTLASSPQEFGVGRKVTVSPSVSSALVNGSSYVTVASALRPSGKLRGQVR